MTVPDVITARAMSLFNVAQEDVTFAQRQYAKQLNHCDNYGSISKLMEYKDAANTKRTTQ